MTEPEIFDNLCSYDPRNPHYDPDYAREPRKDCYCDNCFRGLDTLALEILRLRSE